MECVTAIDCQKTPPLISKEIVRCTARKDGFCRCDCLLPSSVLPLKSTCMRPTFIPEVLIKTSGRMFSRDGLALAITQITAAVLEDLI